MKIFQREQRSLFGEILDWMLTPLLLLWPVSLALTWLVAQGLANKPFDRALEYNAQALAQLVMVQHGKVLFNLPQSASEILRADESDTVYFQVLGVKGEYLAGERDLPPPPEPDEALTGATPPGLPSGGTVQLRDAEFRGIDLRVAHVWVRMPLPGEPQALVQVAETREKRSVLATEIIKGVMLPQFVILPLAALLVWLALARGCAPPAGAAASSRCTGWRSASARAGPRTFRPSTTRTCRWKSCRWWIRSMTCWAAWATRWPRKSASWPTRPTSSRRRWPGCACRPNWPSAKA
jgi:two-component system, OmpR family, sensor histidine kinase TctE